MQSYCDLSLQCGDCKSSFTSASNLLQHFVDHVKEERGRQGRKRSNAKQKRCEQVSESSCESSQSQTLSAASDSQSDSSQTQCKLARFDLQERLETCVKREHDVESIKREASESEDAASSPLGSPDVKLPEEYSPLKFCQITMEENDVKSDLSSSPKRTPSRKQPLPKKIERNVTTLRKLAPKPEGAIVSNETTQVGKKKYACHLCTKVFGWSTDLKRHILVHTGERPFKCENCQATFTRNFLLQKHQSKVHPCKPKPVELKAEADGSTSKREEETENGNVKLEVTEEEEDDDDEDRLVITEEAEEKAECNVTASSNAASDKWHRMSSHNSGSSCADLKRSEMFKATPIKVLTM